MLPHEKIFEIFYFFICQREREKEHKAEVAAGRRRNSLPAHQGAQHRTPSQDPGIMT